MKIRKYAILLFAAFAAVQLLSGCGSDDNKDEAPQEQPAQAMTVDMSKVKDGTYTAESSMDKVHGKAVITLTIADHKITAVDYKGIDKDGTTVKATKATTKIVVEIGFLVKKSVLKNSRIAKTTSPANRTQYNGLAH